MSEENKRKASVPIGSTDLVDAERIAWDHIHRLEAREGERRSRYEKKHKEAMDKWATLYSAVKRAREPSV